MSAGMSRREAILGAGALTISAASPGGAAPAPALPLGAILTPGRMPTPVAPGLVAQRPPQARNLPDPPPEIVFTFGNTSWGALGNRTAGDCVLACAAHMVQLASWHAKRQWVAISDAEVLTAYGNFTGWRQPGDADPGMAVTQGLQFAVDTGFAGHKLARFYRSLYAPGDGQWHRDIHAMSRLSLCRLLCGFGGAAVALDLPYAAWLNPVGPWRAGDMDDRSAGGHCVPIVGYDQTWIYALSWGMLVGMDWAFLSKFSRELYFAYAQDWLAPSGSADLNLSPAEMSDTLTLYSLIEAVPVR